MSIAARSAGTAAAALEGQMGVSSVTRWQLLGCQAIVCIGWAVSSLGPECEASILDSLPLLLQTSFLRFSCDYCMVVVCALPAG